MKKAEMVLKAQQAAKDLLKDFGIPETPEALAKVAARIAPATVPVPELSKESMDKLEAVLTEAKSLGLRAVIIDADKGIRTVGSRKAVATASLYEVTGPEGKAFTVKKGEKYDSLIDLAKGEGLYKKYWAKHPPKDGKKPEEVSISYNKVISSFEGWKVLAK